MACEYQHKDQSGDSVHLESTTNPYNIFLAVAGDETNLSGSYHVDIQALASELIAVGPLGALGLESTRPARQEEDSASYRKAGFLGFGSCRE